MRLCFDFIPSAIVWLGLQKRVQDNLGHGKILQAASQGQRDVFIFRQCLPASEFGVQNKLAHTLIAREHSLLARHY